MKRHIAIMMATAKRILQQLMHDKRTIALMLVAPLVLMSLLAWVFANNSSIFDMIAPALLGVFPFVIMFLVTSITTLRERTNGTLERLMAMPVGKFDIIGGYALAFGFFGMVQSLVASSFVMYVLKMNVLGPQWFVVLVALCDTLLGVALGLFVSAFARTEFQAVQFMPALIFPQLIVCGLFVPLASLPPALELTAYALPLTYAVEALNRVTINSEVTSVMWNDVLVVIVYSIVALVLASMTLRRRMG